MLLVLLIALAYGCYSASAQTAALFGTTLVGDATYYGNTNAQGACSFAYGTVQYLPWTSGTTMRSAI